MIGCPVALKWAVACLLGDESQQPTWPHVMHSRRWTHRPPMRRQSSQPWADGVTSRIWSRWLQTLWGSIHPFSSLARGCRPRTTCLDPRSCRPSIVDSRTTARLEMPAPLRREVRLLGEMLGQVLVEYGGQALLDDVEALRRTVIAARGSDDDERAAERLVASWSVDRAGHVARAFTCYFQLVNLAEERHRARALREREREAKPLAESLAETVAEIRSRHGDERLRELLADFLVQPVLTAHPTESRRRAVVAAVTRVGAQLQVLEDPRASEREQREARRRVLEDIDVLWRTSQLRSTELRPLDEVRSVMSVFDDSLFATVPAIYRDLESALSQDGDAEPAEVTPFIRFGSWVGGDRDGNPSVTAEVTVEAVAIQADHVLRGLESATTRIARALTVDAQTTPASAGLRARLEVAHAASPTAMADIEARSHGEPHRQLLLFIAERIRATREDETRDRYREPSELLADLRTVQASLAAAGARRLARGDLQDVIWQVAKIGRAHV